MTCQRCGVAEAVLCEECRPDIDVERLAQALHEVDGEFCDPFTPDHPVGMHSSQAAALARLHIFGEGPSVTR